MPRFEGLPGLGKRIKDRDLVAATCLTAGIDALLPTVRGKPESVLSCTQEPWGDPPATVPYATFPLAAGLQRRVKGTLQPKLNDLCRLLGTAIEILHRPVSLLSIILPLTKEERQLLPFDVSSYAYFSIPECERKAGLRATAGYHKDVFVSHVYHSLKKFHTNDDIHPTALAGDNVILRSIMSHILECVNEEGFFSSVMNDDFARLLVVSKWLRTVQKRDRRLAEERISITDQTRVKEKKGRILPPGPESDAKIAEMLRALSTDLTYKGTAIFVLLSIHTSLPLRPQVTVESKVSDWDMAETGIVLRCNRTVKTSYTSRGTAVREWLIPSHLRPSLERLLCGREKDAPVFSFDPSANIRAAGFQYLGLSHFGINALRTYVLSNLSRKGVLNSDNIDEVARILQTSAPNIKRAYLTNLDADEMKKRQCTIFWPKEDISVDSVCAARSRWRSIIKQQVDSYVGTKKDFFFRAVEENALWTKECKFSAEQYKRFIEFINK